MSLSPRALRRLALLPLLLVVPPLLAQDAAPAPPTAGAKDAPLPPPRALQTGKTPWLYEGSDIPQDREWLFGKMPNGVRYAVRRNGVPPGQVSIRIRVDAGSLHEADSEQGYAHLLEHLLFRESKYLGPGEAIPTWQRLGATFGSDTNAETSPTHTVYKLDLPNANGGSLNESFRLLSGMVREPVLSQANINAEVPIVLAEKRERGGGQARAFDQVRQTLFAGQRLAIRPPIGTEATLRAASPAGVSAFHKRWYRPENTVIAVAGDADPQVLAALVERWFGDWRPAGRGGVAPKFGDPVAPKGASRANPVGEVATIVEPDLPRNFTYAVMRPWRPVQDTIAYNEGLMLDQLAQSIINRRLEARARGGGSYLYAQVQQDDISRSADATVVSFAPLGPDWRAALRDVRAVIADALATPPTAEEIAREVAEIDVALSSAVEQRSVQPGSALADSIVTAVDIRETTAAPETVLAVFRSAAKKATPQAITARSRALFTGPVIRAAYVTPDGAEANAAALRTALSAPVAADGSSRLAARTISFSDLPAIGAPGTVQNRAATGVLEIEQLAFANGTRALLWANDAEPGRVTVKVRFGAGYQGLRREDGAYVALARGALVESGIGDLGQEELDRLTTGRKMGFDFDIEDGAFTFSAQTRAEDLADQLYLFAAKLATPRWDANPFLRAKAAAGLAYDGYSTSPGGVLTRDLEYLLRARDPRFATPDPKALAAADPAGFRRVWEPVLRQGPVEVLIFGDFKSDDAVAALTRTIGALPTRQPVPAAARTAPPPAPSGTGGPQVVFHRGEADQAAAVISWPTGGGTAGVRESRQLEILTQLFNNRLLDAMRERTGASYAPQVVSTWPVDAPDGGRIMAVAQLRPADVPAFFDSAERIARELATTPPAADELNRVTEPLRQLVSRAATGNTFWLLQLQGASFDPARFALINGILGDYSQTTPATMGALASKYLRPERSYQIAVIPEGQTLAARAGQAQPATATATAPAASKGAPARR